MQLATLLMLIVASNSIDKKELFLVNIHTQTHTQAVMDRRHLLLRLLIVAVMDRRYLLLRFFSFGMCGLNFVG